jgi:hypothetical protein
MYQQIRVMLSSMTSVRLGWLDGCGRMTTACYLLSQKFPQSEAVAFAGLLCPKYNVSVDNGTLLSEVGRVHQNVIVLGFNCSRSEFLSSAQLDSLQQYSRFMLNCQTQGRRMGLSEYFEIMAYELRKPSCLKWNYANELDNFNKFIGEKNLRQNQWPLKYNATFWRLHMHKLRKTVFPLMYQVAAMNDCVMDRFNELVETFVGTKQEKATKSFESALKALRLEDFEAEAVTHLLQSDAQAIAIILTGPFDKLEKSNLMFWCLEQFFLKTGWVSVVHSYVSPKRVSIGSTKQRNTYPNLLLYSMVTSWIYVDYYHIALAPNLYYNVPDRPLRILSAFATTNGGANNMSTWEGMDGWIGEESHLRSLKKVRNHCFA